MITTQQQEQRQRETHELALPTYQKSKWAGRWIWAAVAQGLIVTLVTLLIVQPLSFLNYSPYYAPSKVIASGGAGTWMFTGYVLYLVVGVVAVAVTALFYFYFETILGHAYRGVANYLAWAHYALMNVGVAGSMLLMIWGGYRAGVAAASVASGGLGFTATQIHEQILGPLTNPIGALVLVAALGALCGGLGYLLRRRQ